MQCVPEQDYVSSPRRHFPTEFCPIWGNCQQGFDYEYYENNGLLIGKLFDINFLIYKKDNSGYNSQGRRRGAAKEL